MRDTVKYLLLFAIVLQFIACNGKDEIVVDEFEVQFELPGLIDISHGGEHTFKVMNGKLPSTADLFVLESEEGVSFICPIIKTGSDSFTIRLASECKSGYHRLFTDRFLFGVIYRKN